MCIGPANRVSPAHEQVRLPIYREGGRSPHIEEVHATDPVMILILLHREVVGEQHVVEVNSIVTVNPQCRALNGKAPAEQISHLEFAVAPFRRHVGNFLDHSKGISALYKCMAYPGTQLASNVYPYPILALIGADGAMPQCGVVAARNTRHEKRRDHDVLPAHVVANVESKVLKAAMVI